MNIQELVTHYVNYRRTLGERAQSKAVILQRFSRSIGPQTPVSQIRQTDVAAFLNGSGPATNSWYTEYYALKVFFQFAVSRGHLGEVPIPSVIPKRPPSFTPYVYTRDQIRLLLDAIPFSRSHCKRMRSETFRTIVLMLYATGMRPTEALNLSLADVDLPNSILTVRQSKFFKSRLVPISARLTGVLAEYAKWDDSPSSSVDRDHRFFRSKQGTALTLDTLEYAFRRTRERAQIRRSDGAHFQPRLHDLRHTFAVHRLIQWYRQGADVQRLIHHLSVYLGHASLSSTQVYLTMTAELLQEANARFERYAFEEDRHA